MKKFVQKNKKKVSVKVMAIKNKDAFEKKKFDERSWKKEQNILWYEILDCFYDLRYIYYVWMHWTAYYKDNCAIYRQAKEGNNYYFKEKMFDKEWQLYVDIDCAWHLNNK